MTSLEKAVAALWKLHIAGGPLDDGRVHGDGGFGEQAKTIIEEYARTLETDLATQKKMNADLHKGVCAGYSELFSRVQKYEREAQAKLNASRLVHLLKEATELGERIAVRLKEESP